MTLAAVLIPAGDGAEEVDDEAAGGSHEAQVTDAVQELVAETIGYYVDYSQ